MIDLRLGRWQDVLSDVPDGSVRLILTSPPYDNAREYEGTVEPVDFGELANFALRVLMPGGVLAMVLDGAVNDGVQSVTPYRVICEWSALPGWRLLQVLAYGRMGIPGGYTGRFRKDHEPLPVFVRDGAVHVCDKEPLVGRAKSVAFHPKGTHRLRDGTMPAEIDAGSPRRGAAGEGINDQIARIAPHRHRVTRERFTERRRVTRVSARDDERRPRRAETRPSRFIGAERVQKYHAIGMQRLAQQSFFSLIQETG